MKLKVYLRGIGVGLILAAILITFLPGGGRRSEAAESGNTASYEEEHSGVLLETSGTSAEIAKEETQPEEISTDDAAGQVLYSEDNGVAVPDQEPEAADADQTEPTEDPNAAVVEEVGADPAGTSDVTGTGEAQPEPAEALEGPASPEPIPEEGMPATEVVPEEPVPAVEEPAQQEETIPQSVDVPGTAKTITIPGGYSSDGAARILEEAGLVDSAVSFNRYLIDKGLDTVVRSGVKTIPPGAGYEEIAKIITSP